MSQISNKDRVVIDALLQGTKYYDSIIDFDYFSKFDNISRQLPKMIQDPIIDNTPTGLLYAHLEGWRKEKWEKNITDPKEKEKLFYETQKHTIQGYPFAHWYNTKVYYRMNNTVEKILSEQGDKAYKGGTKKYGNSFPISIFKNLPYRSFFVSTSDNAFDVNNDLYNCTLGFFVTYDKDPFSEGNYLSFHVVTCTFKEKDITLIPVYLYLPKDKNVSIIACTERAFEAWKKSHPNKEEFFKTVEKIASRAIQFVLYICSKNADLIEIKKGSLGPSTRIRNRYGEVTVFAVGDQLANRLEENNGGTKECFMRTSFWKGVHHGKRGSADETIELTWIAPTIVRTWERSKDSRFCAYDDLDKEFRNKEILADMELLLDIENADGSIEVDEAETDDAPIVCSNDTGSEMIYKSYPRSRLTAIRALERADYKCEICGEHATFKRKVDGLPYMEPHHLIPMAYQRDFKYKLDRVGNIVSLCSNCHNEIHYGINSPDLIEKLYEMRKSDLSKIGLEITLKDLCTMY